MIKLFHGKDNFLSLRECKKYIAQVQEKEKNISLITLESQEHSAEQIINHFVSQNMFVEKKILILKRISQHKQKEEILEYVTKNFEKFSKDNFYIFWEDQKVASNTKYFKMFKEVTEKPEMNKPAFYKWCGEILTEYNISADRDSIAFLSSRVNYLSERLLQEVEKFNLNGTKKLTKEIINAETTDTLEEEIWSLTKAINKNEKKSIFTIIEKLLKQEIDTIFIISMIARNIRLYSQVKYLQEKGASSQEICSTLRIAPFTLPELAQNAKNSSWEKIRFLYEKLASLDYEIKRGNIDAQTGLILILNRT